MVYGVVSKFTSLYVPKEGSKNILFSGFGVTVYTVLTGIVDPKKLF